VPAALQRRPKLYPWCVHYLEAFHTLSGSRALGFGGAGPIPLSEIRAYFEIFEVPLDDRPVWVRMMRALDAVWLQRESKRVGNKQQELGKGPRERGKRGRN